MCELPWAAREVEASVELAVFLGACVCWEVITASRASLRLPCARESDLRGLRRALAFRCWLALASGTRAGPGLCCRAALCFVSRSQRSVASLPATVTELAGPDPSGPRGPAVIVAS